MSCSRPRTWTAATTSGDDITGTLAGYIEPAAGEYNLKVTSPGGGTTLIDPTVFASARLTTTAVWRKVYMPLGLPMECSGFTHPNFQVETSRLGDALRQ